MKFQLILCRGQAFTSFRGEIFSFTPMFSQGSLLLGPESFGLIEVFRGFERYLPGRRVVLGTVEVMFHSRVAVWHARKVHQQISGHELEREFPSTIALGLISIEPPLRQDGEISAELLVLDECFEG